MAIELFSSDVLRVFQACDLHASKAMCRDTHVFFLWVSKVMFRGFFSLVFCMLRARILLFVHITMPKATPALLSHRGSGAWAIALK